MPLLTEETATTLLMNYIDSNMPDGLSKEDTLYPNSKGKRQDNHPYLELGVEWVISNSINAGRNPLHRTPGIFIIDICVPKGSGDLLLNSFKTKFRKLFRNNSAFRDMGFVYQSTQTDPFVGNTNSKYYKERVNIFFYIEGY